MSDDKPWEPPAIPADEFHLPNTWANINRAPYDVISGVTYKQAGNIKCVRYEPLDPAPHMSEPWQGTGQALVRWLFSENSGTEENLLNGAEFISLQDITLDPSASSGQMRHSGELRVVYCVSGEGMLYHRACEGCPVIARPLRAGDAVLIQGSEIFSIANHADAESLRMIMIGFRRT